jgi:ABC-type uncharacterized transport system involved in gliding motility auxiliary subunit
MGGLQAKIGAALGALLVFVGVGLAAIQSGFTTLSKYVAVIGVALLLVSAVLAFGNIVAALRTRQGRYGLNVLTGSVLILGILVLVNFLASRYFARADLTSTRRFSLAPQSTQVVRGLDEDATLYAFVTKDDPSFEFVKDRLREYEQASSRVKVRYVNPYKEPAVVEQLEIKAETPVAVQIGDRIERVTSIEEEDITNAIVRASRPTKKKIYFLEGHGERQPDDEELIGCSQARDLLKQENYEIATFSFLEGDSIPSDCALLVVAGPQKVLLDPETRRLMSYLDRGGKLLLAIDPVPEPDGALTRAGLDPLFAAYGVDLGDGVVFDGNPISLMMGGGYYRPIVTTYGEHKIVEGMQGLATIFPQSRPIRVAEGGDGTATKLLETSPRSWEEMDAFNPNMKVAPDAGRDVLGPVPLAVAVSRPATVWSPDTAGARGQSEEPKPKRPETRLVVFGDSDFAVNAFLNFQANKDVFLNTISWLAEEEDLIAVRPKDPENRRLTAGAAEQRFIRMASIIIYPALVLVAGVLVWVRRRRKDV